MFFYARECKHGLTHNWQRSDGTIDNLPGSILRFRSRAERDAFVEADRWDGNYHREVLTRAQIESHLRRSARFSVQGDAPVWFRAQEPYTLEELNYEVLE